MEEESSGGAGREFKGCAIRSLAEFVAWWIEWSALDFMLCSGRVEEELMV